MLFLCTAPVTPLGVGWALDFFLVLPGEGEKVEEKFLLVWDDIFLLILLPSLLHFVDTSSLREVIGLPCPNLRYSFLRCGQWLRRNRGKVSHWSLSTRPKQLKLLQLRRDSQLWKQVQLWLGFWYLYSIWEVQLSSGILKAFVTAWLSSCPSTFYSLNIKRLVKLRKAYARWESTWLMDLRRRAWTPNLNHSVSHQYLKKQIISDVTLRNTV